jgi:uncharacterized protein YndB with AHSA1/START domain
MTTTQTTPIVKEVTIDAPAEVIFHALTDPGELIQWWGSDDTYHVTEMTADVRVGGKWRTAGKGSDGEAFAVEGVYRAVDRPKLLEYTWKHDWDGGSKDVTVVRIELTERNGATLVRLTHTGFTDEESRQDHNKGWGTVLGWLKEYTQR